MLDPSSPQYWPPNPAHSAQFSISLISVLRLNLAREIFVLDSDAAISSGNSGPETCGMRRVQTQSPDILKMTAVTGRNRRMGDPHPTLLTAGPFT